VAEPNPGRQTVEYAITTSDSTTMPTTGLVWQTGLIFNDLLHDTDYYVWARTRENNTHSAGEAVRSENPIRTQTGTFGIRLNRTNTHTFPSITFGANPPAALAVTITNTGIHPTGELKIDITGLNPEAFEITTPTNRIIPTIPRSRTNSFRVRPVLDPRLPAGRYTATVTVSGGDVSATPAIPEFSATFNVSFTVNRAAGLAVSWPRNATPASIANEITATSITINDNAVTMATGTGGQKIEYAITTSTATSAPANLVWQQFDDGEDIEFDDLQPNTVHHIWARSARNENRDAGRAVRSVALRTSQPPVAIALGSGRITNLISHTFASADLGYTDGGRGRLALPPALTVVVRNVGTQAEIGAVKVELDGFDEGSFEITPNSPVGTIESTADTATFTVRPKLDLPGGLHQTRVVVSVDGGASVSFLVRFVVNRVAGVGLTGTMQESAKSATTITIESDLAPAPANGQAVEYAITTNTATRLPANLVWRTFGDDPITFEGLNPETRYIVWARTASNASYNAGTAAQRIGPITTDIPEQRIALGVPGIRAGLLTIPAARYSTVEIAEHTITVNNTGSKKIDELAISITGVDAGSFEIVTTQGNDAGAQPKLFNIEAGTNTTFTVRPVAGLSVKTYNATVTVSDGEAVTRSFNVRFQVTRATSAAAVSKPVVDEAGDTNIIMEPAVLTPVTTGQEVEYAITTNAATRLPANLIWRTFGYDLDDDPIPAEFTGLQPATDYYVWARAVANLPNVAAGTAVRSDKITTSAPEEALRLSITGPHTFPRAAFNYRQQGMLNVTVTNVGSEGKTTDALTIDIVKISGADDAFEFVPTTTVPSPPAIKALGAGESVSFSIRPALRNPGGTHTATITVTDGDDLEASFTVSFTVNRIRGSAVRAVPRATAANITNSSITVEAVEASTPANGQDVEYAISQGTGTPTSGWQASPAFTGLDPLTTYYVFARTAQSDSFDAGAVRRSGAIRTLAPAQGISINRANVQTFRAANWGYAAQAPLSVTITNIGAEAAADVTVTITPHGDTPANAFVVSNNAWDSIPIGGNRNFTIWPRTGLPGGPHRATVTVSGGPGMTERSFEVRFTVNRVAGAAVSGAPVALSSTLSSITVAPVTIIGAAFGNEQVVEYAVSTTNRAPITGWVETNEITGLDPSTQYFVFARSKQNLSHNAGIVQRSLPIQTATP